MFKHALFAALFLSMAAPAQAGSAKLGSGALVTGGDYSTGGGLTVAVEPRAINGQLGFCGVWAQSEALSVYTRKAAARVLTKGVINIDGQRVVRNLNFLNRVRPSPSYSGAPAGCIVVNRPWSGDTASRMTIRIPRQKIVASSGSRIQTGPRVFFTRSDSANPALAKGTFLPPHITSRSSRGSQY
ncbi:MAG: hypothetical protein AAF231_06705 [Pseudomonadota bacterium]